MNKLRLDPDQLRVESFAPRDDAALPRGTVAAHSGDGCEAGATDLDLLTCAGSCAPDCGHDAVFALTNDGRETCAYSCRARCIWTVVVYGCDI
jgi:hypothetical protein